MDLQISVKMPHIDAFETLSFRHSTKSLGLLEESSVNKKVLVA